ncbi:MAG: STAS domain-containing protein [Pseudomonadota bacterium]
MALQVCDRCLALTPDQLSYDRIDSVADEGLQTIEDCLAQAPVDEIQVELGALKRGDAVAVVILMAWLRRARASRVRLALLHPPPALLATLAALGVDSLFELAG